MKGQSKMEKTFTVYCHTNKINGKKYIGITSKKPEHRWNNGKGYSTQIVFARAIEKYGWENFDHTILETNIATLKEANKKERYYISLYHTWLGDENCCGYNKTPGGDSRLGKTYSEEGKLKLSLARKGKPRSELWKLRIGFGNKGKKHSAENIRRSQESAPNKKPIQCIETGIIYKSISEASRQLKVSRTTLISALQQNNKTAGGYHWVSK
jgi:group I intron endonuclease